MLSDYSFHIASTSQMPVFSTSLYKNSSAESATLDHWFNRRNQLSNFYAHNPTQNGFNNKKE